MTVAERIAALLVAAGIAEPLAERLGSFGDLLATHGRELNLTAAREPEALAEHILDSLSVVPYVRGPLVDVGSGGGFPAIPLALATGVELTLVESTVKKARFLQTALDALGLPGTVVADRAERAAHDPALRSRFTTATARAVASAPTVLELTLPFLAPGGRAVLQRGALPAPERTAATDAALVLGGEVVDEISLAESGGASQKRLLIVEQRVPSGIRFPRRTGVPAKNPLCFDRQDGAS